MILGAGHAFDLPLVELAKSFEKLVLVDIDAEALDATVAGVLKDPGLRARTELRLLDLTGINGQLVQRIDEARGVGGERGRGARSTGGALLDLPTGGAAAPAAAGRARGPAGIELRAEPGGVAPARLRQACLRAPLRSRCPARSSCAGPGTSPTSSCGCSRIT